MGGGGEDGLKFTKQLFVNTHCFSHHFACAARLLITQNGDDYGWTLSEQLFKLL